MSLNAVSIIAASAAPALLTGAAAAKMFASLAPSSALHSRAWWVRRLQELHSAGAAAAPLSSW